MNHLMTYGTLLFLLIFSAPYGETRTLTLPEAREIIKKNNLALRAKIQSLEIAKGELKTAETWLPYNPEFETEAAYSRNKGESFFNITVLFSQEIEIGGQRTKRILVAKSKLNKIQAEISALELETVKEMEMVFYSILLKKNRLDRLEQIQKLHKDLIDIVEMKLNAGKSDVIELNLLKIKSAGFEKEKLSIMNDVDSLSLTLRRMLGVSPEENLEASGQIDILEKAVDYQRALDYALKNKAELEILDSEKETATHQLALVKRENIPNLKPYLFYSKDEESHVFGGGISLAIPIFNLQKGKIHQIEAKMQKLDIEKEKLLQDMGSQIRSALLTYEKAVKEIELYKRDVLPYLEETRNYLNVAYREGKMSLFELLLMQKDLFEFETSYLEALENYVQAKTMLEFQIGKNLEEI